MKYVNSTRRFRLQSDECESAHQTKWLILVSVSSDKLSLIMPEVLVWNDAILVIVRPHIHSFILGLFFALTEF